MYKRIKSIIASLKELSFSTDMQGLKRDSKFIDLQIIELEKVADELKNTKRGYKNG